MTHVVVDARMAWDSGIGTYIRNTLPRVAALASDWRFTVLSAGNQSGSWAQGHNVTLVRSGSRIFTVREQIEIASRIPRDADLFWATHYNIPLLTRTPVVVTVHDVGHLRLPEYRDSALRRAYARIMFAAARNRAAGLLFDSRFSFDEFRTLVGNPVGRSAVVHLGVDDAWRENVADASPLAQPYFVYVGNVKPHKNLHVLLDAFERVRDELDAQLVLIGRSAHFRTPDRSVEARVARTPRAALLGELDQGLVRRYVRHAAALVTPSLYEGFGLTPLEAMAAGCPVIVSRAASLPEVCGEAAAYFPPADSLELAGLLRRVVREREWRSDLVDRGRRHAAGFDWSATASATHALLKQVIAAA